MLDQHIPKLMRHKPILGYLALDRDSIPDVYRVAILNKLFSVVVGKIIAFA